MKYLLIVPDLGFKLDGDISPGGLGSFGRMVGRALASSSSIKCLDIWSYADNDVNNHVIAMMIKVHAHPDLQMNVRCFGGSKLKLTLSIAYASCLNQYDFVMYLIVNQSILAILPFHAPYAVWEIGRELFQPISWWKYRSLTSANILLSISQSTSDRARENNPRLPQAQVVYLGLEPPLFELPPSNDAVISIQYDPAIRKRAVFILSRIAKASLDKGHQELIEAWPEVIDKCADAELWIGGSGDGIPLLKELVMKLPLYVTKQIHFLGYVDDAELHLRFQQCRIFAMPSRGEGFGLVFVEAGRYGIPCIGSIHDSVKELVINEQTGLLVEQSPQSIAAACVRLLKDDQLAKRLGDAGRQRYLNNFQFHHFRQNLLHAIGLDT